MIIGQYLHGQQDMIINFSNKTVTWDNHIISMRVRCILTSQKDTLNKVYLIVDEPQTLRDEYSHAVKILDG
jgi:hypothetical protein